MCLTQLSAPLDKFGMAPLAFECEQTHHDTGTAFRLRINAALGKSQAFGQLAVGDERPGRKPGEVVWRTDALKLGVETANEPIQLGQGEPRHEPLSALR